MEIDCIYTQPKDSWERTIHTVQLDKNINTDVSPESPHSYKETMSM